jgi:hypothetical protein
MSLLGRWFLIGSIAGLGGVAVWQLFLLWLDHTEQGRRLCYVRAIQIDRQRFEVAARAGKKVSMDEGVKIGRPSIALLFLGGSLLLVEVFLDLFGGLPNPAKPTALPGAGPGVRRWQPWYVAFLASRGGALAVMVGAALLVL